MPTDGDDEIYNSLKKINPDALIVAGFEVAYIGHTVGLKKHVAVYRYEDCIDSILGEGDITVEEAEIYFRFHTLAACKGENAPLFVRGYEQ
jgi:hypothetical protein